MAENFNFKKAEPIPEFLKIALSGPSSSGKTVSALRLALGLTRGTGKKICLIDTENNRSLKYAKFFEFDHVDFQPPFTSLRYLDVILQAEKLNYGAIIIDQMTNEHEGPGGVLEQHEDFLVRKAGDDYKKREALKFTAWIEPKRNRNKLIQNGIERINCHLILCFRAKEKTELRTKIVDGKKKIDPVNVGWSPIGGEEFPFAMLTNMILPPKSEGRPDWNLEASTINSLDNELINLLHGVQQINENLGVEMARLCGAPAKVDPMAAMRKLANEIVAEIKAAPTSADVQSVWNRRKADLEQIKTSSSTAFDALEAKMKERMATGQKTLLDPSSMGCPTCGGGDPGCPDCGAA